MASVEKFTDAAVTNQLRHNAREIITNSNKDIDKARTHLNYSLTPERSLSPRAYYAARKKELYVYGRKDVKTMAGLDYYRTKRTVKQTGRTNLFSECL